MTSRHDIARPFTGWTKQTPPDPATVTALYAAGDTERTIAQRLGVSRQHVADALAAAGLDRRPPGRPCPVEPDELRRLVEHGCTQAQLAARFSAAAGTVSRWLAEAGIGEPDPRIDHGELRRLYVEDQLTAREVAAHFRVSHNRVLRELALAGIHRRSRHQRRPRGNRAAVTDELLHELYLRRGLTIRELAARLDVSDEYLRKRLREAGLAKRPGSFRPKLARPRADLAADAVELYTQARLGLRAVAAELGVSATLVRELLHEAGVPVRPPGVPPGRQNDRDCRLLHDLYADAAVAEVLGRFDVPVQDAAHWVRPGPCETIAPLPLPAELVQELYVTVGLSAYHISLVCGIGTLAVTRRLRALGIELRPSGRPCPWTLRTYG